MKLRKDHWAAILLGIFYLVGVFGMASAEWRNLFLQLTPFNLLLTLGLLIYGSGKPDLRFLQAFLTSFFIGFWIEVAGVHSGVLFGSYSYGTVLGPTFLEVPLLIGVNWFLLAIAARWSTANFGLHPILRILAASGLMVALDVLIEPVAMKLSFWNWAHNTVPLQNYLMWFATALVIQALLHKIEPRDSTFLGRIVLLVQALFFSFLNL
ncbi:MAG: carotenoid biosynthesis protein [Flavobacteriales bacterium]|nr:carotenoid biosynthesis protein [Flavobacteriales bacterium]